MMFSLDFSILPLKLFICKWNYSEAPAGLPWSSSCSNDGILKCSGILFFKAGNHLAMISMGIIINFRFLYFLKIDNHSFLDFGSFESLINWNYDFLILISW